MISDYDDTSESLTLDIPSGLPENFQHVLNVLEILGVKDDAMLVALINDCLKADPMHVCRMVQKGLLSGVTRFHENRIAFSGTVLHIPGGRGEGPLPPAEVLVSLKDNAVIITYYDKEDEQYTYGSDEPIFPEQVLDVVQNGPETGPENLRNLLLGLLSVAEKCYRDQSQIGGEKSLLKMSAELGGLV